MVIPGAGLVVVSVALAALLRLPRVCHAVPTALLHDLVFACVPLLAVLALFYCRLLALT